MPETLKSYRELRAWQMARKLVKSVYLRTKELPAEERYGLVAQMRSAAISIPANIAEGYGRRGRAEYAKFLCYSIGSLYELETYVFLCTDVGFFLEDDPLFEECNEVSKVLGALERSVSMSKA